MKDSITPGLMMNCTALDLCSADIVVDPRTGMESV